MRKIFSFLMVTMDGYDEGPAQEFDFWNVDPEFDEFSVAQLDEADTLLFGRVTYEGMAAHWPTKDARQDSPAVAERMNGYPKLVVSSPASTRRRDRSSVLSWRTASPSRPSPSTTSPPSTSAWSVVACGSPNRPPTWDP
jgi:dihydrofolate reductase